MTILIVEDADLMRLRLRDILVSELNLENENIHEAKNGHEALSKYDSINPDYVFLDIYMPGISGVDTVEEIKKIDPDAYIIMVTSSSDKQTVINCIRNGAKDYIKKPPTLEKVSRALNIDVFNPRPVKRADRQVEILSTTTIDNNDLESRKKAANRDIIEEIIHDTSFEQS